MKREIEVARGQLVVQANELIQQTKSSLTMEEKKLVTYVISMIKPSDKEFQTYEISANDFADLCGLRRDNVYSSFKEMIDSIDEKACWIKIGDEVTKFRWFNEPSYIEGQGKIRVVLNSKIKPYLLELKRNFTQYELWNVLGLRSKYAISLYELFKSYSFQHEKELEVDYLKRLLGCENYKNFKDFRRRVLEPGIGEINEETDIDVEYTKHTKGRKVVSLSFKIKQKPTLKGYTTYLKVMERMDKKSGQVKGQMSIFDKDPEEF